MSGDDGLNVLVLGAGGPAGVNVCRALRRGGHHVIAADSNPAHLAFVEGSATFIPWEDPFPGYEAADVVMAQPDPLVLKLSDLRDTFEQTSVFLPSQQTVARCQDKFECGLAWRRAGLREDRMCLVDSHEALVDAMAYLEFPFWLRARAGAGARGAVCARSYYEALYWWQFWNARGKGQIDFVAEEYLPGRDYSWCGIYYHGSLVAAFQRQRLEYLYPHLTPEGLTGTPTIARVTDNEDVSDMAIMAVNAVTDLPHGVFCVDLRENKAGDPKPTEINAGRFSTTVGLWSLWSERTNFVALAAELAVGESRRVEQWEELPVGLTLSRHIDCGHIFTKALELYHELPAEVRA